MVNNRIFIKEKNQNISYTCFSYCPDRNKFWNKFSIPTKFNQFHEAVSVFALTKKNPDKLEGKKHYNPQNFLHIRTSSKLCCNKIQEYLWRPKIETNVHLKKRHKSRKYYILFLGFIQSVKHLVVGVTKYKNICASKKLKTNVYFQKKDINLENMIFCFF